MSSKLVEPMFGDKDHVIRPTEPGETTPDNGDHLSKLVEANKALSPPKRSSSRPHLEVPNLTLHQRESLFHLTMLEKECEKAAKDFINESRKPEDHLQEDHPEVKLLTAQLFAPNAKKWSDRSGLSLDLIGDKGAEIRAAVTTGFRGHLRKEAEKHHKNRLAESSSSSPKALSANLVGFGGIGLVPSLISGANSSPFKLNSVYESEYQEISVLGQGGYGQVFRVRNHLDKQEYAIKKIVISSQRVKRYMEADQIDALLVEVQTLAKLNHPNIVRYFHAWIEYKAQDAQSVSQSFTDPEPGDHRMLPEPNTRATGTDYGSNVNSEIGTQNLTSEYGGHHGFSQVFDPASGQERYDDNVVFGYSSVHHSQSQHVDSSRVRRASHATTASNMTFQTSVHSIAEGEEDDPEVENIPRTVEEIGVSLSKADLSAMRVGIEMSSQSDYFEQDITLLIKMSLHPMTLSKYLSVDKSEDSHDMDLRHCFHEDSSLSILGAILDGLDYLHSQNIIHRDIKPANIFLSIHEDKPPALKGCVNVRGCSGCSHLDRTKRIYVTPCIGDFGLTAELKPPVKNSESDQEVPVFEPSRLSGLQQKPVGTLFYRPRSMPNKEPIICPKLDVYSLGVIALEMIQKFGTKSERATVISALKQGILPTELEDHVMAEGILSMVCEDRDERWDCLNVRKWLEGLQRKGMGEGKEAL